MGKPGSTLQRKVATADISTASKGLYDRVTGRKLQRTRQRIGDRDGYRCRACGLVSTEYEVDHIVPLCMGGADSDENRQLLCKSCHQIKCRDEERRRGGGGP